MSGREPLALPQALWRRALLGPMPLAYPLIAVNVFYYALSFVLSMLQGDGSPTAFFTFLWSPAQSVLGGLGMGGLAPLASGEVWTLVTAPYLHANLAHLILNMICLGMMMPMAEASFGRLRAFVIYAAAGICGSLASAFYGDFYSLGASGAIFGLFGSLLTYGSLRGDQIGRRIMMKGAVWAALNFLFSLSAAGLVSIAAQLGGFIGGILVALVMIYGTRIASLATAANACFALASVTLLGLAIGAGAGISSSLLGWSDPNTYAMQLNQDILDQSSAVLAWDPDNGSAHAFRGVMYSLKDDDGAAMADFDAAIAAGVDSAVVLNGRAWSLFRMGRAADGLPDAEAALKADPGNPAMLDTRAHIYEALGRRDEAIADYQAALSKDPTIPESQAGLKRLTGEQ